MLCIVAVALCVTAFAFSACGESAIAFKGSGEIKGVTYNVTLTCGKEEKAPFTFTVAELPELSLDGTYEYDSSKGYRFTFNDKTDTIKVPKYDATKGEFKFSYNLNLGDKYGSGEVTLTLSDTNFVPGNETFFEPFSFYNFDDNFFGMTTLETTLTLFEDGTCTLIGVCPLTSVPTRTGTYTFDAAANKYTFYLGTITITNRNPDGTTENVTISSYETTYDAATNTYSVTVHQEAGMMSAITVTYTPEG